MDLKPRINRLRLARKFVANLLMNCLWFVATGPLAADEARQREITADRYIETSCTFCHSRILAVVLTTRRVETLGVSTLDASLIRHHLPDVEARDELVRYFENLVSQ